MRTELDWDSPITIFLFFVIGLAILAMIVDSIGIALIIVLGILAIFVIGCLIDRWFYWDKVLYKIADPLFIRAAKYSVKKGMVIDESFKKKKCISDDRFWLLKKQLELSKIVINGKIKPHTFYELRPYFKTIKEDSNYFINRQIESINKKHKLIDEQICVEKDQIIIALLKNLKYAIWEGTIVDYLKHWINSITEYHYAVDTIEAKKIIQSYSDTQLSIQLSTDSDLMAEYESFVNDFTNLKNKKLWNKDHSKVKMAFATFGRIEINETVSDVLCIKNSQCHIYFYPTFIICYRNNLKPAIQLYKYKDIHVNQSIITEIENSWFSPKDVQLAFRKWEHSCLDGSPDMRFKYNSCTNYYSFNVAIIEPIKFEILTKDLDTVSIIQNIFQSMRLVNNTANVTIEERANNDYNRQLSPLGVKIKNAILHHSITVDNIERHTFVQLLRDYQVFKTPEERLSAQILQQAISDGTLSEIMTNGITTKAAEEAMDRFIQTTNYDASKIKRIITDVFYAFESIKPTT